MLSHVPAVQDVEGTQERQHRDVGCPGQDLRSPGVMVPPWTTCPAVSVAPACPYHAQTGLSVPPTSALSFLSELALGLGPEPPLSHGALDEPFRRFLFGFLSS